MRIVVTGAAGRLGRQVCQLFDRSGRSFTATDIARPRDWPFALTVADLLDRQMCYRLVEGADAVVHLGNYRDTILPDHQRIFVENTTMNMNVFQAACELGLKRIVFASSVQVIGGTRVGGRTDLPSQLPYLPLDGDVPPRPGNPYALSKVAGEAMLEYASRVYGLTTFALRFPWLSGPGEVQRWRARDGGVSSHLDEGLTHLPVSDAAALILACLDSAVTGHRVYMPAAPETVPGWSAAEAIDRLYKGVPLRASPAAMRGLVDCGRIRAETGWSPTDPAPAGGR